MGKKNQDLGPMEQSFLHTEKDHKDWYNSHYQGKSRGRPWTGAKPEGKKPKKKK